MDDSVDVCVGADCCSDALGAVYAVVVGRGPVLLRVLYWPVKSSGFGLRSCSEIGLALLLVLALRVMSTSFVRRLCAV